MKTFLMFICLFYAGYSHANTVPSTPNYPSTIPAYILWSSVNYPSCVNTDTSAVCGCVKTASGNTTSNFGYTNATSGYCQFQNGSQSVVSGAYTCQAGYTGPDASHNCALSNPANVTTPPAGTTYSCAANYQLDTGGATCTTKQACTKGSNLSSGYFDLGTNPNTLPSPWICTGTCGYSLTTDGNAYRNLVNGVYHYAIKGSYDGDGANCTAPTGQTTPNAQGSIPDSCATGQAKGTVQGVTVCVNQSTGAVNNPNTPVTSKTTTTSAPVTNADGSKTVTTTQTNADGSTTTQSTTTQTNGSSSTTYTYTPSPTSKTNTDPSASGSGTSGSYTGGTGAASNTGTGTGSGSGTASSDSPHGTTADPLKVDICSNNPNSPMCKQVSAGSAAGTNGIYTKDASGKTFASVINDFKNNMQAAPFYAAVTGFFSATNIPSGSCTGLSGNVTFPLGHVVNVDMTNVLCGSSANYFYSLLSIGLLLVATFLAFKIAIL